MNPNSNVGTGLICNNEFAITAKNIAPDALSADILAVEPLTSQKNGLKIRSHARLRCRRIQFNPSVRPFALFVHLITRSGRNSTELALTLYDSFIRDLPPAVRRRTPTPLIRWLKIR
jgi:hypothetical protein